MWIYYSTSHCILCALSWNGVRVIKVYLFYSNTVLLALIYWWTQNCQNTRTKSQRLAFWIKRNSITLKTRNVFGYIVEWGNAIEATTFFHSTAVLSCVFLWTQLQKSVWFHGTICMIFHSKHVWHTLSQNAGFSSLLLMLSTIPHQ